MMQVISKWRISVHFDTRASVVVCISDNHLGNVLRALATMDFSEHPLEQPTGVEIALVAR